MKIYLAGSCSSDDRTMMKQIAKHLRTREDTEVYCPFELQIPNAWDMSQEEWAQKVFDEDVRAIKEADVVVLITPGRESTAGTNWEQGYAYALGKRIFVFQVTDKPTSLMTYCGCDLFFNTTSDRELYGLITSALSISRRNKRLCDTTLT